MKKQQAGKLTEFASFLFGGPSKMGPTSETVSLTPPEAVSPISAIHVEEGSIRVQRQHQVYFPREVNEGCIALRLSDWNRVKSRVSQVIKPPASFSGVYFTLFGIAATALCSVLPFFQIVTDAKPWVRPFFWILFAFSLFFGFVFIWVDSIFTKKNRSEMEEILKDMTDVEKLFKSE